MADEKGTRESLPYWVEQKHGYGGGVFLDGVVLGFTRGQWPVQAFAADEDGGCKMAARWVAEKPEERVVVGPIAIPDDVPVLTAVTRPVEHTLVPRDG